MSKAIFKTLREQSAIGFEGKVIFQEIGSGQHRGVILLFGGMIVGCSYSDFHGRKAIINLLVEDFSNSSKYSYVVEPEVIDQDKFLFEMEVDELEIEFRNLFEKLEKYKNLRPPRHKRLIVNADFICRGGGIEAQEYDVLCLISDFGKVEDVYNNSELFEFEVTNALVSLRKKGALKVLA